MPSKKVSEKNLEKKLREVCSGMGGVALKFSTTYYRSIPDRLIFMPFNHFYFAELKSDGKGFSEKQQLRAERFRIMGFTVFLINSHETLKLAILKIKQDAEKI